MLAGEIEMISCNYTIATHRLYKEIKNDRRGPNPAAPNVAMQMGLHHTSMGNAGLCNLLNAANIASPAKSTLQKHANQVGEKLVDINKADMKSWCDDISTINQREGLAADAGISVQGDCRFNTPLYGGTSKTPYQPASQAVYTICENVTSKNKIILIATPDKLCHTKAMNDSGQGVNLPGSCHHNANAAKHA